jgi:hypothetical protein
MFVSIPYPRPPAPPFLPPLGSIGYSRIAQDTAGYSTGYSRIHHSRIQRTQHSRTQPLTPRVYAELAEQYKLLDPASALAKRHVLADHLKEVIDTLEAKAGQICALYELLAFHDKPASTTGRGKTSTDTRRGKTSTDTGRGKQMHAKSVGDVMRMVKESLGEEVVERLRREWGR